MFTKSFTRPLTKGMAFQAGTNESSEITYSFGDPVDTTAVVIAAGDVGEYERVGDVVQSGFSRLGKVFGWYYSPLVRFKLPDTNLVKNSQINSAIINWSVESVAGTVNADLLLYVIDEGNASAFTSDPRVRDMSSVVRVPSASFGAVGPVAIDITNALQEVVNRSDWASEYIGIYTELETDPQGTVDSRSWGNDNFAPGTNPDLDINYSPVIS